MRALLAVLLVLVASLALPPAAPLALPQDDAGSGRDAPDAPWPFVEVEPGRVHAGVLLGGFGAGDRTDHYAFHGLAGQVVDVVATGELACVAILDVRGAEVGAGCVGGLRQEGVIRATRPADGLHYLRSGSLFAQRSWSAFDLDAPARGVPPLPLDPPRSLA